MCQSSPQNFKGDGTWLAEISDSVLDETNEALDDFESDFYWLLEELPADASAKDAIDSWLGTADLSAVVERTTRFFISQVNLETNIAGPVDRISAEGLLEGDELSGGDYLPVGGYSGVVDFLGDGLDIRTEQAVQRIVQVEDGVEVYTDDNQYYASHVIVTVPLGVLKSDMIEFNPPLPTEKQQAVSRLEMGNLEKVILRFDEAFWQAEGVKGFSWLDHENGELTGEFPAIIDISEVAGAPTLVAFYGGGRARADQGVLDDDEMVSRCLEILSIMLEQDIPEPSSSYVTHWTIDPYSMGSYSFIAIGASSEDFIHLAEPMGDGRILFAGEATHEEFYQTAHGALLSGLREAERLGVKKNNIPGLRWY